jgi:hypothetical protein
VIATGIGDDAAATVLLGKRRDLVVGAAQLERADGLAILRLEVKLTAVFDSIRLVDVRPDQFCPQGDAV